MKLRAVKKITFHENDRDPCQFHLHSDEELTRKQELAMQWRDEPDDEEASVVEEEIQPDGTPQAI